MAIEQERAAEAIHQKPKLLLDRAMEWAVGLVQPLLQLLRTDRPAPEEAMLLGSCWDDPEAAARPRGHSRAPRTVDHRRIDLVLPAVAIDCGAWSTSDDGADAALDRPPGEAVDQRVLQTGERGLPARGHVDQPVRIIAARMGDGQQDRQVGPRRVN